MNRSGAVRCGAARCARAPWKRCIICARGKRAVTHITSKYLFSRNGAASPPRADAFASGGIYGRPTIRPPPFALLLFGLSLPRRIEINYRHMGARNPRKKSRRKNSFLWISYNGETPVCRCDPQPHRCRSFVAFLHAPFLPLLLPAYCRAVIGLDRESDVVHIETRIAKGSE